ncbi:MAG: hypothetical protein ACLR0U_12690 [Enterocloster clostridioformis]
MICKYLTGAIDYNPQDSFRAVGVAANMGSQAIICRPDAPYNTWAEFIEYAKANPGQVTTAISHKRYHPFYFRSGSAELRSCVKYGGMFFRSR